MRPDAVAKGRGCLDYAGMEYDRARGAERQTRSSYAFHGILGDPWEFPWEVRAMMFWVDHAPRRRAAEC